MSDETEHWSSPNGCHEDCPACEAEDEAELAEMEPTERDRILAERAAEHRVRAAAPALLKAARRAVKAAENPADFIEGNAAYQELQAAIALTQPPTPPDSPTPKK